MSGRSIRGVKQVYERQDRPRATFLDEIQAPPEEAVKERVEQLRFIQI